jgi:hypothetical protein
MIILSLKGLPGTGTLAYCKHQYITTVKSFMTLAPTNKMSLFIKIWQKNN